MLERCIGYTEEVGLVEKVITDGVGHCSIIFSFEGNRYVSQVAFLHLYAVEKCNEKGAVESLVVGDCIKIYKVVSGKIILNLYCTGAVCYKLVDLRKVDDLEYSQKKGTTVIEGQEYKFITDGLDAANELKRLRGLSKLKFAHIVGVALTFLSTLSYSMYANTVSNNIGLLLLVVTVLVLLIPLLILLVKECRGDIDISCDKGKNDALKNLLVKNEVFPGIFAGSTNVTNTNLLVYSVAYRLV